MWQPATISIRPSIFYPSPPGFQDLKGKIYPPSVLADFAVEEDAVLIELTD
jgi:hypothetical protein